MKQVEWKKVENCFSGTNVYEYRLPIKVDDGFINCFSTYGSVKYFRNFPRPFFKADFADGIVVKGVLTDSVIKVSFPDQDPQGCKQKFDRLLEELINQHEASGGAII
ncbi:MAG: hypothetical protein K0R55_2900 [Sporomusa sp.]|jgi:hypothetical protein|nr:hypothetical protein [Sporomusa sp.]